MNIMNLNEYSMINPAVITPGFNAAAIVDGTYTADAKKTWLKSSGRTVDLSNVEAGMVVEFVGYDLRSEGGWKRVRLWYLILKIADEKLEFAEFPSLGKALKAARDKQRAQAACATNRDHA